MFGRRMHRASRRLWEEAGGSFPWMREEGPSFGPHGPFGSGNPHGEFGPGHHGPFGGGEPRESFGPGRRGPRGPFGPGRFFGRGDMKFVLLSLLQERPMYGYEMIKALEERSGGFYVPSPGSIYPTLQMLEERGFVTSQGVEGKKVYSITDEGRQLLQGRQDERGPEEAAEEDGVPFGPPWMRGRGRGRDRRGFPELQAFRAQTEEVMRLFGIAVRVSFDDPARFARLRTVIETTRSQLNEIIYEGSPSSSAGQQPREATPTSEPTNHNSDAPAGE